MKIYLDDLRPTPEGWIPAKNFAEFKHLIEEALARGEKIEAISFDNDLGESAEGYDIAKWLKDNHPECFVEAECTVHSDNAATIKNIGELIEFVKRNPKEVIEAKNRPDPWGEMKRK